MGIEILLTDGVPCLLAMFRRVETGLNWMWIKDPSWGSSRNLEYGGKHVEENQHYIRIFNRGRKPLYLAPVRQLLGTDLGVTVPADKIVKMEIEEGLTIYAMSSSGDGDVYVNIGSGDWEYATLATFGSASENDPPPPPHKYTRKPLEES